jgi:ankyrin repeat protein
VAGQILIDAGADVNAINKDGKSPLAWATKENSKEMVKLLEMHGEK